MRMMFDSITAADIPSGSELVAGYIDGFYEWTADEWAMFPGRGKVRVAAMVATNDGDVLDVEYGDAWPSELPGWLTMRRATGADPSAYINLANWQACKDACAAAAVAEPHWWLAHYDGVAEIPDGTVAKQYANPTLTGGHYDASVVADFWPGIDKEEQMASVSKDTYIAADPTDGKSLEDRVKETDRVLWVAEFVPQMRAELAQSSATAEQKAVVEALLDVLENALKPRPTDSQPTP